MSPAITSTAAIAKKAITCFDGFLPPMPPDQGGRCFTRSGSEDFRSSGWTTFGISAEAWSLQVAALAFKAGQRGAAHLTQPNELGLTLNRHACLEGIWVPANHSQCNKAQCLHQRERIKGDARRSLQRGE
jgi:hypothetical protein